MGRLDFNTEGLLLLTNDGDFTNFITSARNKVDKVYEAKVKGVPDEKSIERLRRGVTLEDGVRTAPAKIGRLVRRKTTLGLKLCFTKVRTSRSGRCLTRSETQ